MGLILHRNANIGAAERHITSFFTQCKSVSFSLWLCLSFLCHDTSPFQTTKLTDMQDKRVEPDRIPKPPSQSPSHPTLLLPLNITLWFWAALRQVWQTVIQLLLAATQSSKQDTKPVGTCGAEEAMWSHVHWELFSERLLDTWSVLCHRPTTVTSSSRPTYWYCLTYNSDA